VERVDAMTRLPTERPMVVDDDQGVPPPAWPGEGRLEFRDVCLRYRNGLPLALDNLSFSVPPGKSVGVVGRTGAGSLIAQISFATHVISTSHVVLVQARAR
jgi:ATP-binding cassette, subfamily C (CFTR/MRP), member 1